MLKGIMIKCEIANKMCNMYSSLRTHRTCCLNKSCILIAPTESESTQEQVLGSCSFDTVNNLCGFTSINITDNGDGWQQVKEDDSSPVASNRNVDGKDSSSLDKHILVTNTYNSVILLLIFEQSNISSVMSMRLSI